MKRGNRVVILGSSGFIGTYLVSWLQSQGYSVIGVDREARTNIAPDIKLEEHFYQITLPDQGFVEVLRKFKPDAIINASGPASVAHSISDPASDFIGSVDVCFFILETIRKTLPECKYLFLSSAAVYGNPISLPIREVTSLKPISPYGYHKMICETLVKEFTEIYQIRTSIVRIFSAYGPGLRKQILWDLYQKTTRNNEICLFGDGNETRDFIFVQDIARALHLVLEKTAFAGEVINVANGCEVSIRKLSKLFIETLNTQNKKIVFSGESKAGDPRRWCADNSQLKNLGYEPIVTLEQGIHEYAKWVLKLGNI